tara:strand:+ start:133 stop:828 length:696 start_codon:yes stop_codon:yes gene_type:complete
LKRWIETMKVLLIEDDEATATHIAKSMRQHGHVVDHVPSGRDGLFLAVSERYDVLIIDRMLPEMDGMAAVKAIRNTGVETPILFLTALGGIDDRVEGLEAGGDDYLVKPFAFAELLARVSALARRPPPSRQQTAIKISDLEMDMLKRVVTRAGRRLELQPQEFKLLEYLMRHAGQVVTKTMLLENVWGYHFDPQTTVVETHISRLRGKVDQGFDQSLIHTVRGSGYCLREN